MWVFDGEEWTQEGGGEQQANRGHEVRWTLDELVPELQVVQVVPQLPKNRDVPPLPMP